MLHHARDVPARRYDGLMPGILVQACDDRSYRGTLVFQAGKHLTPDVVVSQGLLLALGPCPSWDVRGAAISSPAVGPEAPLTWSQAYHVRHRASFSDLIGTAQEGRRCGPLAG